MYVCVCVCVVLLLGTPNLKGPYLEGYIGSRGDHEVARVGRPTTDYKIVVRPWESSLQPCISCMCVCMYVCMYVCICMYVCMYVCMYILYVCMYVHIYVCTYVYMLQLDTPYIA